MHDFWMSTLKNRLILPPILPTDEILDLGCGTGIWAIEVADEHNSKVYGVDISPIQSDWVPINCEFQLANVLEELPFHDEKFGLVQSRCLYAGIPDDQWREYMRGIWRVTRSGGWVQLIE